MPYSPSRAISRPQPGPAEESRYPLEESTYPLEESTYPLGESTYPLGESTYPAGTAAGDTRTKADNTLPVHNSPRRPSTALGSSHAHQRWSSLPLPGHPAALHLAAGLSRGPSSGPPAVDRVRTLDRRRCARLHVGSGTGCAAGGAGACGRER